MNIIGNINHVNQVSPYVAQKQALVLNSASLQSIVAFQVLASEYKLIPKIVKIKKSDHSDAKKEHLRHQEEDKFLF